MITAINTSSIVQMIIYYVVNELDFHDLYFHNTGLYEIAKVHGGKLISEPIRNLTVDEILDIVNKENEYGPVETKRLPEDE